MHPSALIAPTAPATTPRLLTGALRGALLAVAVIAAVMLLLVIWHILATTLDWPDVRDFVAPTAAEARAHGWVALSERAVP